MQHIVVCLGSNPLARLGVHLVVKQVNNINAQILHASTWSKGGLLVKTRPQCSHRLHHCVYYLAHSKSTWSKKKDAISFITLSLCLTNNPYFTFYRFIHTLSLVHKPFTSVLTPLINNK